MTTFSTRSTYWAALGGAVLALLATAGMLVVILGGVRFQPTDAIEPLQDFLDLYNDPAAVDGIIAGFTFDSLFLIAYLVVFLGLGARVWQDAPLPALVGLIFGVLTAVLDATENAHLITYAYTAKNVGPLTAADLAVPGIYLLTNLKWMSAFVALLTLGLAFPRDTGLELAVKVLMLVFVLVGIAGVLVPALLLARSLFFIVGMILFAALFWGYARAAD